MLRLSLTFAGAVALNLALGGLASAQPANTAAQFQKAYAVAQGVAPGAQLIKSRLEKGGTRYGFYFWKDGQLSEVEIDLGSLEVVKQVNQIDTAKVSPDVVKLIGQQKAAKTKLPEGRLLEIAADALKDTGIAGVEYAVVDGKLVFKIGDLTLDAATGKTVAK